MQIIDNGNYELKGLNPSPPDERDYKYSTVKGVSTDVLPRRFMNKIQPVVDQGQLGSCGGFGFCSTSEIDEFSEGKDTVLSPLFIYSKHKMDYNDKSEGVNLRDLLKSAQKYGICQEILYPYPLDSATINKAKVCEFPKISDEAILDAQKRKLGGYARVFTLDEMKKSIVNSGGILAGMLVSDSFMNPQKGVVGQICGVIHGGHAINFYGFDEDEIVSYDYSKLYYGEKVTKTYKGVFYFKNSWNTTWGDKGIGKIPMELFDANVFKDFYYKLFNELWNIWREPSSTYNPDFHKNLQSTEIKLTINNSTALVNGNKVQMDCMPLLQNDRILLPVRFLAENLCMKVDWDESTQTATLTKASTEIKLTINSDIAIVNGKQVRLDCMPVVMNDRILIPLRFIASNLGAKVIWDDKTRTATITI